MLKTNMEKYQFSIVMTALFMFIANVVPMSVELLIVTSGIAMIWAVLAFVTTLNHLNNK